MRALAVLAGLAIVAAALAAFAPAALVALQVAGASRGELRLAEARGTIWRGNGVLAAAGGRWSVPIAWTLEPWPLVHGEARIALRSPDGGTAKLVVREGSFVARDVTWTLPARALRLPAGAHAGGEITVNAPAATIANGAHEGSVRLDWSRARVAAPGAGSVDLGTATATLTGEGARWRGPFRASGGELDADGVASVDLSGAEVSLTVVPGPGAPDALRTLLGAPDAGGAVRLRFAPRFR